MITEPRIERRRRQNYVAIRIAQRDLLRFPPFIGESL